MAGSSLIVEAAHFTDSQVIRLDCSLTVTCNFYTLCPPPLVLALPSEDVQNKFTYFFLCMQIILSFLSSWKRLEYSCPFSKLSFWSCHQRGIAHLVCVRSLRSPVLAAPGPSNTLQVKYVCFFKGPHHGYSLELVG